MIDKIIAKYLGEVASNPDDTSYSKAKEYVKKVLGDEWTISSIGVDGYKIYIEVTNKKTKTTKEIKIKK